MKEILRLFLCYTISILFFTSTQATEVENGKILHNGNCLRCHDVSKYTRKNRIIKNFQQLHERVKQCEIMAELMWFDEEIENVTAYLNLEFYKFDIEK